MCFKKCIALLCAAFIGVSSVPVRLATTQVVHADSGRLMRAEVKTITAADTAFEAYRCDGASEIKCFIWSKMKIMN